MFGQLDGRTRERIADLLTGLLAQDTDRVLRALDALEIRGEHVDPRALRRDVAELVASYSDLTLDTIDLGVLLRELIAFIRTHHLHIPPDLVLLIRSLVTIEGVGRALDPHFDIAARAPAVPPHRWPCGGSTPGGILAQTVRTARGPPAHRHAPARRAQPVARSIKRGELTVRFDLQHFERLVRQLTRASNTLAVGIVIAGLLVGSSLVLRVGPASLAYAGFAIAAVLGLWLVWNIVRN